MPKQGTINNPHGRPKGSQNKLTRDHKELFAQVWGHVLCDFGNFYDKLTPREKTMLLIGIAKYFNATVTVNQNGEAKEPEPQVFQIGEQKISF